MPKRKINVIVGSRKSKNVEVEEAVSKIVKALSDPKWEYRTARGISADTKVDVDVIKNNLDEMKDLVRVSVFKSKEGEDLYTLKERKSLLGDYWTAFKSMNTDKFGGKK